MGESVVEGELIGADDGVWPKFANAWGPTGVVKYEED